MTIRMIRVSVLPTGYGSRTDRSSSPDTDSTTTVQSGPTASRDDDVSAMPAIVLHEAPAVKRV